VVQAAYRRRGVGTRLLEAVEAWGRANGATLISLDTFIESPLSVPFYEQRMGYQRLYEQRMGYQRLYEQRMGYQRRAIIFQKRLG
jgi:GNAT superfamily N-acetyltransferase